MRNPVAVAEPARGIKVRIELFISFSFSKQLQILRHFLNNLVVCFWFLGEMSEHHRLGEGMRWIIVGRLEAGQFQAKVSRELNITRSVITHLWSQFKTSGTVCKRQAQDCPRATPANEDRYLFLSAASEDGYSQSVAYGFRGCYRTSISSNTVFRRLHERELYA